VIVAMVGTRFGGLDRVSLEADSWPSSFEQQGQPCHGERP
jgi:hypothetical protein